MAFNGLMMGCTKRYWEDIIKKIYSSFGTSSFSWSDVMRRHPDINKSNLSRLKCSAWIVKDKQKNKPVRGASKSVLWKLPPEAVTLCTGGYTSKIKPRKVVASLNKVCKCQTIKKN